VVFKGLCVFFLAITLWGCTPKATQVQFIQEPTQEVLFAVRGTNLRDVGTSIHGHLHGGYAGFANWNMDYTLDAKEALFGNCIARKILVIFYSKITLPDWKSSGSFDENLLPRWNRFIAGLKIHEEGHIQIALDEAKNLAASLEAISPVQASDCTQLHNVIRERLNQAMSSTSKASQEYDFLTKHGVTQGAVAEWYE
jgi:predicted secreted Zn-dependent protease